MSKPAAPAHTPSPYVLKALKSYGVNVPASMMPFVPDNTWLLKNSASAVMENDAARTHIKRFAGGVALGVSAFAIALAPALLAVPSALAFYGALVTSISALVGGVFVCDKAVKDFKTDAVPGLKESMMKRFIAHTKTVMKEKPLFSLPFGRKKEKTPEAAQPVSATAPRRAPAAPAAQSPAPAKTGLRGAFISLKNIAADTTKGVAKGVAKTVNENRRNDGDAPAKPKNAKR